MAKKCKYALTCVMSGPLTGREEVAVCKSPNRPQNGSYGGTYKGYPIMGGQMRCQQWYRLCIMGKYEDVTPSKCRFYK